MKKTETIYKNQEAKIKFVKKANMWCVSIWKDGKQKQDWFPTKEKAKEFLENYESRE